VRLINIQPNGILTTRQTDFSQLQSDIASPDEEIKLRDLGDSMLKRGLDGDVNAQLSLGMRPCYSRQGPYSLTLIAGLLYSKDEFHIYEAARWFKQAAEDHHHPFAQFALGVIYFTGSTNHVTITRAESRPPYFIDVDNLEEFLGKELGITPNGEVEKKFDFRKWLKQERKRLTRSNTTVPDEITLEQDELLGLKYLELSAKQGNIDSKFYVRPLLH